MKYYLDCEFNGFKGELISMALVSAGYTKEIYLVRTEMELDSMVMDEWVKENVIPIAPHPSARDIFLEDWGALLADFFKDDTAINIVADWPDDIKYFCQVLITGPGKMIDIPGVSFEVHRVDAYPTKVHGAIQHNALWDARALRFKLEEQAQ